MLKESVRATILDGALTDYEKNLAGRYKGYYITMTRGNNCYVFSVNANMPDDETFKRVQDFLAQKNSSEKSVSAATATEHNIQFALTLPASWKKASKKLNSIVDEIVTFLANNGCTSGCATCGTQDETLACYEIKDEYRYLCNKCGNEVSMEIHKQNEELASQKSNLVSGIIGAVLGAMLGAVLWILIYKLGYIAGIAGAAMGLLAMKGYEMLGKCLDKKGVVVSVIVMFIMIYFANRVAWTWEAYGVFQEYGSELNGVNFTFGEIFQSIEKMIKEIDCERQYYADLVIGYLLTLFCSASTMFHAFKGSSGNAQVKKLG